MKIIKLVHISLFILAFGSAASRVLISHICPKPEIKDYLYNTINGIKAIVAAMEYGNARTDLNSTLECSFVFFLVMGYFFYLLDRLKTSEKRILELEIKMSLER